ncbi:type II toxin-antitoxin system mRNA interferase toxin, RelE/StbE family [Labrys okinawensis]|uniref:Type II toxin-antitoxin system mRNA interferase toxin, RelE/StbE family n=1 Tax=Labrys okinawensis TaxID=346911 RepID=A0A2S9QHR6_9HYPH|nr:type II toxin-antitoxin system RelE/ParE family toxin [Labrys okinawensis]PRH88901.1 type II toxin-antitoxin system mRNA interferase toxin, RelE/StbE family [Labrys okinawensis]
MQVRWTTPALSDIEHIHAWHKPHSEHDAAKLVSRLRERAESLAALPKQGRPGRVAGTRELTVSGTSYLILYRLRGDYVDLLRVLHTRQQWPLKS